VFFVTYLRRELRRRMRQAIFIALGLALGAGLVVTVAAASAGVKKAQADVLGALYGVGTDVTVTGVQPGLSTLGSGQQTNIGLGAHGPEICTNGNCVSAAGQTISLVNTPYTPMSETKVTEVAGLHDVAAAVGGLTLVDQTATFPKVPTATLTTLNNVYLDGVDTAHTSIGR
jgi:putative ABC transport system permease protein